MHRTGFPFLILALICPAFLLSSWGASAQTISDTIISEHIRIRIPMEREWLGREVVTDLNRCWIYVNGATGDKMPRKVLVDIRWDQSDSSVGLAESRIVIGMDHPAAVANMRGFLLHSAARELGRLGLMALSKGGGQREETEFLTEGMSEMLAREYARTTRSLSGAWILAQLLDRMNLLGLKAQASWSSFSGGRHDLRAAAPGITFLMTCRELYGRDKVLKLFEALRKGSLAESIGAAFKTSIAALEGTWLQKVREFRAGEDVTAATEEDAPRLERTVYFPEVIRPGATVQVRLFMRLGANALLPEGIYIQDETSNRVFQARTPAEKDAKYSLVELPVESGRQPGSYNLKVVALDEGGNVRTWTGTYAVRP